MLSYLHFVVAIEACVQQRESMQSPSLSQLPAPKRKKMSMSTLLM